MGLDREEPDLIKPDGTAADALPAVRRDAIDLNNEIAGRDTGRNKRFLSSESSEQIAERKRDEERRLSALMRAMQDPAYAAAYQQTKDTADAARRATEAASLRLQREAQDAADRLEAIRASAARLPDGTCVYQSRADGRLYTEDGVDVTDQRASVTGLTENAPAREDIDAARERMEDIAERQRQVERYERTVLSPVEERLRDEDNPPTRDQLERDQQELETEMPADIRQEFVPTERVLAITPMSAADEYVGSADLNVPDLNSHFTAARDESYDSSATPSPTTAPKPS